MPLNIEQKKAIVAEVAKVAQAALSAVAADCRGLPAVKMDLLRAKARSQGVYVRVVRNTLARRALQGTDFACMTESLKGPLILAFSETEPGAAARLMKDFSQENKLLTVKFLSIGGVLHGPEKLESIAKLPTYDESISILMSVMKAPVTKLVRTVQEPHAKLVRLFAAVRDQKQAS
jgi:large subunit ribosomal protein L10